VAKPGGFSHNRPLQRLSRLENCMPEAELSEQHPLLRGSLPSKLRSQVRSTYPTKRTPHRPQTTDHRPQTTDHRLQTTDYRLQPTAYSLQPSHCTGGRTHVHHTQLKRFKYYAHIVPRRHRRLARVEQRTRQQEHTSGTSHPLVRSIPTIMVITI
jgi:hypothetical protein